MTRLYIGAALVLLIWALMARAELTAARAELARVEAKAAGLQEAARFHEVEARRREQAAALDMELQQGAGADAPLSDYLRHGAGRVWP